MDNEPLYLYKLIIIGDSGVGKTTFLYKHNMNITLVDFHITPTVGIDYYSKKIKLKDKSYIKTNIWDISGKQEFRIIVNFYIKEISAAFLLFNLHDINTFNSIKSWINNLLLNNSCDHYFQHPIILIGNKFINKTCMVTKKDIDILVEEYNLIYYEIDIFNVNHEMIQDLFDKICNLINEKNIKTNTCKGIKKITNNLNFSNNKKENCCIIS